MFFMFGILNIKGASLDKNQLEEYIEKFASDNVLGNEPNMDTNSKDDGKFQFYY